LNRASIDRDLILGAPQAQVARRFKISSDAVSRHARSHLAGAIVASNSAEPPPAGDEPRDVVSVMLQTQSRLLVVIDRCERTRQTVVMIQAVRELRMTVEAIARLTGAVGADGALRHLGHGGDSVEVVRERLARKIAALCYPGRRADFEAEAAAAKHKPTVPQIDGKAGDGKPSE
jgi:hypothetical protein